MTTIDAFDRLHRACIALWRAILCHLAGHDWDYFSLTSAETGNREYYRCCMRCEHSEMI